MTGVELLIGGTAAGLATVAALLMSARRAGQRRARAALLQARHEALRAVGVREAEESSTWVSRLSADVGGLRLHLDELGLPPQAGVGVKIRPSDPWPLTLERENKGSAIAKVVLGARELVTGDPAFDDAFYVTGTPVQVRAALDASTRAALLVLSCEGLFTLDPRGVVTIVRAPDLALPDDRQHAAFVERLAAVIGHTVAVARRLSADDEPASRLAAIVRTDPVAAVRRACLDVLLREFEDNEITRQLLPQACADVDPELRLRAAVARGDRGVETLATLAQAEDVPDRVSAAAVTALGGGAPVARTRAWLERARAAGRQATACACVARLRSSGDTAAAIGPLVELLPTATGPLAVAACEALVALGATSAEGALSAALRGEDEDAQVAAAQALGALGSVESVPSLREVEQRADGRAVRRAAREAVAAIQERASGATPGQLSLAATGAGQLALSDDMSGRVALAPEPSASPAPRSALSGERTRTGD